MATWYVSRERDGKFWLKLFEKLEGDALEVHGPFDDLPTAIAAGYEHGEVGQQVIALL